MNPYEIYGSPVEERPSSKYGREEESYNRPIEPYRRRSPGELSGFSCSLSSKVKFCGEASCARIRQRVKPLFKERRFWAARIHESGRVRPRICSPPRWVLCPKVDK